MKTDNDILTTYGLTSETRADGVTYRCKVKTKEGGIYCEGLGTTYAGAQDTAFYACAITARGYQPDIPKPKKHDNMHTLTWHQQNAARRNYRLRNHAAHIKGPDFILSGLMLCGRKDSPVTIDPEHRASPANKCCLACRRVADKLGI